MKSIKDKKFVFDFDGVIGNSMNVGYAMHNFVREKYGLPIIEGPQDYLMVIDNNHLSNFMDFDRIRNYYLECNAYYEAHLSKIKLFPAMKELLKDSSYDIIIISSCPDSFIREILKSNGIDKITVYGKEVAKSKKERFAMLLEDKNISKEDIIYIGDTIDDFHFCEQVGIPMIGSNYGYSDLSGLKDLLLELMEQPEELVEYIKPKMLVR